MLHDFHNEWKNAIIPYFQSEFKSCQLCDMANATSFSSLASRWGIIPMPSRPPPSHTFLGPGCSKILNDLSTFLLELFSRDQALVQ